MPRSSRRTLLIVLASVAAALVLVVVAGLFFLDSLLLKAAREQADAVSARIGRPVKIGDISTKVFSGLAVRVSSVEIGPAAGEQMPLLSLQQAEVKASLLKAVRSRGKEIEIRSAEIEGLAINIIRFPDGTTNLERLQSKLAADSAGKQPEEKGKTEGSGDLSGVQLDHFRFSEGMVRFIDQAQAQGGPAREQRELEIRHLEVALDHLKAGDPLEVVVKAAVLAEKQNFELQLKTAPLPASLVPVPKRMTLKIQPVDLKPLAPYFPRSFGLQEGRLSADLTADLGSVVPGGEGETRVNGELHALGLRFSGAEGGKPLDVVMEAGIRADASKGDLELDRLRVELGPAGINGKGKALGLLSGQPRIEGLEIVGHDLDPAKIAAVYPPLQRMLKGQLSGPIGLVVRGSGTEAAQAIEVQLDFTPVRVSIPGTMTKTPGAPMSLLAHLRGASAGTLRFDLRADLAGVDLRPGHSLDKPPGQPLDVSISGSKSGEGGNKAPLKVQIAEMTAHVRDALFSGSGSVEMSGSDKNKKTDFELAIQSPRVDLDTLLLPSSKKESGPPDPKSFAGLRGHAAVKIGALHKSKLEFSNVLADLRLKEDELTVQTLSMGAFGGKLSVNGSTFHLAHTKAPFKLVAQAQSVEVAQALSLATDYKILSGTFNGELNFSGAGTDQEDLIRSLSGTLQGHLLDGKLLSKDLIASVSQPLANALPRGLAAVKAGEGTTSLGKDLPIGIKVEKGFAKLKAPLHVSRPEGEIELDGGIHLDGKLNLSGTIALAPSTVTALTQGKVTISESIPVSLKLGGPAWKPVVTEVDLKGAVASIAKQAATGALGRLFGGRGGAGTEAQKPTDEAQQKVEDEVKKGLKGLFGK